MKFNNSQVYFGYNTIVPLVFASPRDRRAIPSGWQPNCQPNPNGINPVPGDCTKFYLCAGGNPNQIQVCGPGTAFNGQTCVWPQDANCDAAWRQWSPPETTGGSTTGGSTTSGSTTTTTTDSKLDMKEITSISSELQVTEQMLSKTLR